MIGRWKALVVLLWLQTAVAATAAGLEWAYTCGACRAGGLSLGLPGVAFYAGLSLAATFAGPSRLLFAALFLGFGIHVMLVVQLVASGLVCWLCFGAAGVSLAMTLLAVLQDRANLARLPLVLPWSVLLVIGLTGLPSTPPVVDSGDRTVGSVRILVFDQPECPYCDELKESILPVIEREFGNRVRVVRRPARELPAIRRTPTVIVSPPGEERTGRVFEGLPTLEMLRSAVREAEQES